MKCGHGDPSACRGQSRLYSRLYVVWHHRIDSSWVVHALIKFPEVAGVHFLSKSSHKNDREKVRLTFLSYEVRFASFNCKIKFLDISALK